MMEVKNGKARIGFYNCFLYMGIFQITNYKVEYFLAALIPYPEKGALRRAGATWARGCRHVWKDQKHMFK